MKISKLKYVFAFMLMVVVATLTNNAKAVTMPNNAQISISTIIASQLAAIEDGDEPSDSTYQNLVYLFNSGYSTNDSALGSAMNPVYSYSVQDTTTGTYSKVYGLNYGNSAVNREGVEYTGIGNGSYADNKIGLGLAFGLNYLSSEQASNQEVVGADVQASSIATQMYIWIVNAGLLGTPAETEVVNANLTGNALAYYYNIRNSVEQSSANPSYTYASQQEANAHPIEMNWNEANGRYEYTVTDENGLETMSLVALYIEANSGIQYTKNGNSVTFYTTEQVGSVNNPACIPVYKSINSGRWVPGYATTVDNGQQLTYLSARQNANSVTYVSFYTNALRVQVTKQLGASASNSKTGDATVAGAVYGVYADYGCTQLVQEITTDANGVATTRPLEYRDYYVKEISQSEGTKIDGTTYTARAGDAQDVNGQRVVNVGSTNPVIYGGFRMIVSVSDLSGSTTKDPAVGSKLKLTLNSNPNEYYETVVDEHGYADFTDIPYGHYTCTEIEKVRPDLDFMDPLPIYINSEETFIYSKLINTEVAQRYVRIEKQDAESGKIIPMANTVFQVRDSEGNLVIQSIKYPEVQELSYYTTDEKGYLIMPEKLPYGEYTVYEVTAPDGYYNEHAEDGQPSATFKVESNTVENPDKDAQVVTIVQNMPQKVNLTIRTTGQVLTGTYGQEANGYDIEAPAYGAGVIPGAQYKLTAKTDIKTGDQVVHMAAGESVTLTANENGEITTKLYLGSYTLEQVSVPEGYVLDSTPRDLTYTYKGQTILEQNDTITYSNVRQEYEVHLTKEFEDLQFYRQNENEPKGEGAELEEYADVVVGIYAAEDITDLKGNVVIEEDDLVDVVRMNNDGTAMVNVSLPTGNFYAKELETNENYVKSEKEYAIAAKPENNVDQLFRIDVETIVNEAKKVTKFTLVKIEDTGIEATQPDDQSLLRAVEQFAEGVLEGVFGNTDETIEATTLEGAKFAIYYEGVGGDYPLLEKVNGELVEVVRTTDENGQIVLEGLPYGKYMFKELEAPRYYDLNENEYRFEVTTEKPEVMLTPENTRTLVDIAVTVKDEDGNLLKDAKVDLVDPLTNTVAYSAVTDENGVAHFEQIRAGRYIRKVSALNAQYVLPEDQELYAEEDSEVTAEVEVKFVKGNILVYKTDAETGEPVAGCKFKVTNELGEVVAEGTSDENGYYQVNDLRYGVYYVEETEAAEGYEKDGTIFQVTIEEDGVTLEVNFTNVPTGDIAVVAYVVMALVSLGVIAKTVKKLRMN